MHFHINMACGKAFDIEMKILLLLIITHSMRRMRDLIENFMYEVQCYDMILDIQINKRGYEMVEIRDAAPEDAAAIAEISTGTLGYSCGEDLVRNRLANMENGRQRVFAAVENGKVVGFLQAELYQLLYQKDQINILGLAVRKEFQGKGVGRLLVQYVQVWAKQMNCDTVRVNSATERYGAHAFYEKMGFINTKSQKRFVKTI